MVARNRITVELRMRDLATAELRKFSTVAQVEGRRMEGALGGAARGSRGLAGSMTLLKGALPILGFAALGAAMRKAASDGAELSRSIAEISTLVDSAVFPTKFLADEVQRLGKLFGRDQTEVAEGLYQTISAGATDAAEASAILEQSLKLATAGVASTDEAVRALIGTMNAYALEADEAGRVSDLLFTTVQKGVTRLSLLSTTLSTVTPTAAALGLSLEEVLAAVAAITAQGTPTSEAITKISAVLTALLKNSKDVDEALQGVGKSFNVADIAARGLGPVLNDLRQAFDENEEGIEGLVQILGRKEGVTGVLQLTGENADLFAEKLRDMSNAVGATDTAFQKIVQSSGERFRRFWSRLGNSVTDAGKSILDGTFTVIDATREFTRLTVETEFEGFARRAREAAEAEIEFAEKLKNSAAVGEQLVKQLRAVNDERIKSGQLGPDPLSVRPEPSEDPLEFLRGQPQLDPPSFDFDAGSGQPAPLDVESFDEIIKRQKLIALLGSEEAAAIQERVDARMAEVREAQRILEDEETKLILIRRGNELIVDRTLATTEEREQIDLENAALLEQLTLEGRLNTLQAELLDGLDRELARIDSLVDARRARVLAEADAGKIPVEQAQKELELLTRIAEKRREVAREAEEERRDGDAPKRVAPRGFGEAIEDNLALFSKDSVLSSGVDEFFGSIETGFDRFADAALKGEDAFKAFTESVLKDVARLLIRGALRSLFGGLFGAQGAADSVASRGQGLALAEGGVVSGRMSGSLPIRAYQQGGIADSPQLAVFGEGRGAEAFVPLPGPNRGIPVEFKGPSRGEQVGGVNANVSISVSSLDPRNAAQVVLGALPEIEAQLAARLQNGRSRALVDGVRKAAGGR